jgi:serine/threonine-protein kinase
MSEPHVLRPGAIFAQDFRVLERVGQGGMGAVYVAEQLSTGKRRALKVMLPELGKDAGLRRRFDQEARVGARIASEHVVEIVGAGVDPATRTPWLAMELLEGNDLSEVIPRRGALPMHELLAVFEQVCHAVAAAHDAGIVHRDLKPENIFLAHSRRAGAAFTVKVLDFGIAKALADASRTAALGSPGWMAPEQADSGTVTPATDVWALGLVAFYLLTGRCYWKTANNDDATVAQMIGEILFGPLPPASLRAVELGSRSCLPAGFDAWFARCVARDPRSRYQDAREAFAWLRALGGGAAAVAPPVLAATVDEVGPGQTVPAAGTPMAGVITFRKPRGRAGFVAATLGFFAVGVAATLGVLRSHDHCDVIPSAHAAAPAKAPPLAILEPRRPDPAPAPFDVHEAKKAMDAAAARANACKHPGGPLGGGRVVVTFAPDGAVIKATVSGAPFESTATGACVASRFRDLHVPAFSGAPVSAVAPFAVQ